MIRILPNIADNWILRHAPANAALLVFHVETDFCVSVLSLFVPLCPVRPLVIEEIGMGTRSAPFLKYGSRGKSRNTDL